MAENACLMLCPEGDTLVGFQVSLVGKRRIIAFKIGMRYPEARALNLYFVNPLEMIRFAAERDIPEIEMGATTYASKLLSGGHIEGRSLHFRFRRPISNRIADTFQYHFDLEANDTELAAQGPLPGPPPRAARQ